MQYLKVKWVHNLDGEPVFLYSELTDDRSELRKVEVFACGKFGYAYDGKSKGTTGLSETAIPSAEEIAKDPQFEPEIITKFEFEEIFKQAIEQT